MKTELQRIANVLGISTDMEDSRLCLLIQDKIKKKDKQVEEKTFCYHMVKAQNKKLESEVHNLKIKNEFSESVGIGEHMIVKQSRDDINKQLNKVLKVNNELNETIRKYKEREFKDRLKKIELEGVR